MKILVVIVVLVAGFAIVAATRPPTYHVERSATVNAPPATIYTMVSDFHQWLAWSPWEKLDPDMKKTFGGTAGAPGSSYAWVGNSKAGEGNMVIEQVKPGEMVQLKLSFIKPFASSNTTRFTLTPSGAGTTVRWTMDGDHTFMSKAMGMFKSMDAMVGPDFERGLAQMKTLAENGAGNAPTVIPAGTPAK